METIRKILTALMFIVYLLALSMAAFGNERTDSLVRSKARLTNPELLETLSLIPHNCPTGMLNEQLVIEVLVDSKGKVTDYKIPACPDRRYEKRLINRLEELKFIPAISVGGVAVPGVVKISFVAAKHLI